MASGTQPLYQQKSVYFSPAELGISGKPSMKELTDAMPNGSIAVVSNNDMNFTDTEMTYGTLISVAVIFRSKYPYRTFAIGARTYANITLQQMQLFYAAWNNDMYGTGNGGWVGWKEVTMS